MKVILPGFSYSRNTAIEFTLKEISDLSSGVDYSFFASPKRLPQYENLEVTEKNSAWIKILQNEEDQIASYQSTCRNEVRRSMRTKEFTIEINSTPIDELYQFHKLCETERNWFPVPKEELNASVIICVRYLDELIAGMTAYFHKDIIRVGRIFSRRKSEKYQDIQQVIFSSASRRVVHEFTRFGSKNGFLYLDLGGISLNEDSKLGITKFKLSFGSEITPMYLGRILGKHYLDLIRYCKINELDLT
jgi:hypothetical protein